MAIVDGLHQAPDISINGINIAKILAHGVIEIAADLQRLSTEARDGSISREDLTGSTITITFCAML